MDSSGKLAATGLARVTRNYLQRSPLGIGKGLLWDTVRSALKRYPTLLDPAVIMLDGYRMQVRLSETYERTAYFLGHWTPAIEYLMRSILRSGDTFVDVGANVGYFTLLGSRLVGETGSVFAFEPSASTFRCLETNISLNGFRNISVYRVAVSDQKGYADLYQPPSECTAASLRQAPELTNLATVLRERVETIRLDQVVPVASDSVRCVIKLDIEGAEYLALKGMERLLGSSTSPHVISEICDEFLRELGSSEEQLLDLMSGFGYSPFVLTDVPGELLRVQPGQSLSDFRGPDEARTNVDVYFAPQPQV